MANYTKADWEHRQHALRAATISPLVEYKTIDESVAWIQLQEWIEDQLKLTQANKADAILDFENSGNYTHEGLAVRKARVDIINSQVLLLQQVQEKIMGYTQKED